MKNLLALIAFLMLTSPVVWAEKKYILEEPTDEVDPEWAKEKISEGALIVDLRMYGSFIHGALGGAVNIPLAQLDKKIGLLGTDKQRHIVFYGYNGKEVKATIKLLRKKGFVNLYNAGSYEDLVGDQSEFENQQDDGK